MELVFEVDGPVVRDRITKKKCKKRNFHYPNLVRFTLIGERAVDPEITSETEAFGDFPCPIYISAEGGLLHVSMFLYRPDTTYPIHPIYAVTDTGHYLWEVRS